MAVKDDRGGTLVPDETIRLKTPGPCQNILYYGLYDIQLPDEMAAESIRQEICGGRFWRGPLLNADWEQYGQKRYTAQCRSCGHRVRL